MRLAVVLLTGCAGTVLHAPHEWPDDFSVRQSIDIRSQKGDGHLDAVVQKKGDTLIIVGLGPMNARAFSVKQTGTEVEYQHFVGPELPFPPRAILLDVQRVYFRALPPGQTRGELDGEPVLERWEGGELREKTFGDVHIEYGPGCAARCHPVSAVVENRKLGYTLTIQNSDYEAVE